MSDKGPEAMIGLPKRLRNWPTLTSRTCEQAADLIETLERALAEARMMVDDFQKLQKADDKQYEVLLEELSAAQAARRTAERQRDEAIRDCRLSEGRLRSRSNAAAPMSDLVRRLRNHLVGTVKYDPESDAHISFNTYCPLCIEAADEIKALEGELVETNMALAKAHGDLSKAHRAQGEADGRLKVSEMAGLVDGWREMATGVANELANARAALHSIGRQIADGNTVVAMQSTYAAIGKIDAALVKGAERLRASGSEK